MIEDEQESVVFQQLQTRPKMGSQMQVSKWLQTPILIEVEEMKNLFESLVAFEIWQTTGVLAVDEGLISPHEFLDCYQHYIDSLKRGELPSDQRMRNYFSSVLSLTRDALYSVIVAPGKQLVAPCKPVVQLQSHRFGFGADKKFRSMAFGEHTITWGIQFSFPQLFQNEAMQVLNVKEENGFINAVLYRQIQKWVRENTVPTPFVVDEQMINSPIRLGKKCFDWINNHPQLANNGIRIRPLKKL